MAKQRTDKQRIALFEKIKDFVADGNSHEKAFKKFGISSGTYTAWKAKFKNVPRAEPKTPRLLNIQLPEAGKDRTIILIGDSEKLNTALGQLERIYRGE